MEYTLITTTNGPVISVLGKHAVIMDTQDMLALAEEGDDFINRLEQHIVAEGESAMAEFMEGFAANTPLPPQKIYSYIAAVQQFLQFKNNNWGPYQRQRDSQPHA